jgi:transcription elongation GreA/GreB family factor
VPIWQAIRGYHAGVASKAHLKAELLAHLSAALDAARAAHAAAVEGATHSEARAENDKDTRGLEQSYLARGQAQRVAELEGALIEVETMALRAFGPDDPVALGALVTVEEDGAPERYFVAPHGGGAVLDGGAVHVVTPRSPVGVALLGRRVDDDVELRLPGRRRELMVVAIS